MILDVALRAVMLTTSPVYVRQVEIIFPNPDKERNHSEELSKLSNITQQAAGRS